jgi:hypothetical protein
MSEETPKDDPRQKSDQGSHRQTDKPWKGNPEKEQRNKDKIDLEKWQETNTHWRMRRLRWRQYAHKRQLAFVSVLRTTGAG